MSMNSISNGRGERPSTAATVPENATENVVNLATVYDNTEEKVEAVEEESPEEVRRKKLIKAGLLFMLIIVVIYVVLDYTVSRLSRVASTSIRV